MDLIDKNGYTLRNLSDVNIVVGKNGCGKSRMLTRLEQALSGDRAFGAVKYVTPERGGQLKYEPHIDQNISQNERWLANDRRKNQTSQFRQQSVVLFRKLELLTLRKIEKDRELRANFEISFDSVVDQINGLLDNIKLVRTDPDFQIVERTTEAPIDPAQISSGEAELISLAIECLVFAQECDPERTNLLLIDEPDVHLHPDLQTRFANFLCDLVSSANFHTLIATHSTALLGALTDFRATSVAFMVAGDRELSFERVSAVHKKILPVFGAHPLSSVFVEAPALLVEGEDDERIWQQAVRSSGGALRLYPCAVEGAGNFDDFENAVRRIVEAVYDNGRAFSLRDRDDGPEEIDDRPPLTRMRLACRSAENLILCDDVLNALGTTWEAVQEGIAHWIETNHGHPHFAEMQSFAEDGFDRKGANLKAIRNDLMGVIGSNKPWEVAVGQVIGGLRQPYWDDVGTDSIFAYLGQKTCSILLPG